MSTLDKAPALSSLLSLTHTSVRGFLDLRHHPILGVQCRGECLLGGIAGHLGVHPGRLLGGTVFCGTNQHDKLIPGRGEERGRNYVSICIHVHVYVHMCVWLWHGYNS